MGIPHSLGQDRKRFFVPLGTLGAAFTKHSFTVGYDIPFFSIRDRKTASTARSKKD